MRSSFFFIVVLSVFTLNCSDAGREQEKSNNNQPTNKDSSTSSQKGGTHTKASLPYAYKFSKDSLHKYRFSQYTEIQQKADEEQTYRRIIDGNGEILFTPLTANKTQVKLAGARGKMIRHHPHPKPTDTVDVSMDQIVFGNMTSAGELKSEKGYIALMFKLLLPLPKQKMAPGDSLRLQKKLSNQVQMTNNVQAQDFLTKGIHTLIRQPDTTVNGHPCYKFVHRYRFNKPDHTSPEVFKGTIKGNAVLTLDKQRNIPRLGRIEARISLTRKSRKKNKQGQRPMITISTHTRYSFSRF